MFWYQTEKIDPRSSLQLIKITVMTYKLIIYKKMSVIDIYMEEYSNWSPNQSRYQSIVFGSIKLVYKEKFKPK